MAALLVTWTAGAGGGGAAGGGGDKLWGACVAGGGGGDGEGDGTGARPGKLLNTPGNWEKMLLTSCFRCRRGVALWWGSPTSAPASRHWLIMARLVQECECQQLRAHMSR